MYFTNRIITLSWEVKASWTNGCYQMHSEGSISSSCTFGYKGVSWPLKCIQPTVMYILSSKSALLLFNVFLWKGNRKRRN
jgi:hypothetical protein